MGQALFRLGILALVPVFSACASGGGGGADSSFRSDMGRLLPGPLAEARAKIWGQYQIPLYRETFDSSRLRYESEWMMRAPTPAEEAAGVLEARNQVVIRGRKVEEGMDLSPETAVFRITFEAVNQVRLATGPDWQSGAIPGSVVDRFRQVLADMELELRTGVRR